jgi:DME family drug/metabolite transporter
MDPHAFDPHAIDLQAIQPQTTDPRTIDLTRRENSCASAAMSAAATTEPAARLTPSTDVSREGATDGPSGAGSRAGVGYVLLAALLWGSTGTAAAFAPGNTPRVGLGACNLVIGGTLLGIAARPRRARRRALARRRWALILGALSTAVYPLCFYPAAASAGVAPATIVALGIAPVGAGLLSWLTQGIRPGARWSVATVLAVLGCTLLAFGHGTTGNAGQVVVGLVLAATAGLSYAVSSIIAARLIADGLPTDGVMGAMFVGAGVVALPVVLATGPGWLLSWRGAAVACYLAIVPTFLAYRCYARGLSRVAVTAATTLTLAEPAAATILSRLLLGQRPTPLGWLGVATVGVGLVVLAVTRNRRER